MASGLSAAKVSTLGIGNLAECKPGFVHARLLFVGDDSLQMNMLCNLVSDQFSLPAACIPASEAAENDYFHQDNTLVIFDCHSMTVEEISAVIKRLPANRTPGVVLLNYEMNSAHEALAAWPHITGMLQSSISTDTALKGFSQLLTGGLWLPRYVMESLILSNGRKKPSKETPSVSEARLTKRETQILIKLAEGASNTQIADALFLSEHTVKTHLYNIYRKVKVKNRTQASKWLNENIES